MKPVYNDELYHYGKRGMKWGKRKNNKSTIKKAGNEVTKKYSDYYKDLTTSDKIKIGAAMVALLLASNSNQ